MTKNDSKEWVTVKVPDDDHERASDYKPDGATWGDCLVAGAEKLNDSRGTDPAFTGPREDTARELVAGLREELGIEGDADLEAHITDALAEAGGGLTYDDVKQACVAAIRDELPVGEMGR